MIMLKIGITGTIASGKTSVSILLRRRGFSVFNSDNYAKMALHQGNVCYEKLIEVLGKDVLDASNDIDRGKMAEIIFSDEEKRKQVNAIVHPYVVEGMRTFFSHHNEDGIVFAEVPLLFEAHLENEFDMITVVTCNKDTAIQRMIEDREYSLEEANARYDSQINKEEQIKQADYVIENDGDLKALDQKINAFVKELRRKVRDGKKA